MARKSRRANIDKSKPDKESFSKTIRQVEKCLESYYRLDMQVSACQFTLEKDSYTDLVKRDPESRAEVCLVSDQQTPDEAFLGIYFSDDIKNTLNQAPPQTGLTRDNLDAFTVVIEELSHFHLICQRSLQNRKVSKLELEWQAEIDKVLVSSLTLMKQEGSYYIRQLLGLLFDQAIVNPRPPYPEAHKLAGKFWKKALDHGIGETIPLTDGNFQQFMVRNYHNPLQEKSPFSPGAVCWLAKKNTP